MAPRIRVPSAGHRRQVGWPARGRFARERDASASCPAATPRSPVATMQGSSSVPSMRSSVALFAPPPRTAVRSRRKRGHAASAIVRAVSAASVACIFVPAAPMRAGQLRIEPSRIEQVAPRSGRRRDEIGFLALPSATPGRLAPAPPTRRSRRKASRWRADQLSIRTFPGRCRSRSPFPATAGR